MLKAFKSFFWSSLLNGILFLIAGIVMMAYPLMSARVLAISCSVMLIISGIVLLFTTRGFAKIISTTGLGVVMIILGLIIYFKPGFATMIVAIVAGVFFIITGVTKLRLSFALHFESTLKKILSIGLSILTIIAGVVIITEPLIGIASLVYVLGITMVIFSVSDIVNLIVMKKNVKEIEKHFNKLS